LSEIKIQNIPYGSGHSLRLLPSSYANGEGDNFHPPPQINNVLLSFQLSIFMHQAKSSAMWSVSV